MAQASRTAILVVHGMGNQRPLETLRAAADAIYRSDPRFGRPDGKPPRTWLTFDRDDDDRDVDLPMLTTSNLAGPGEVPHYADFHECYWAHLMAEARFVAVPLWLFELVRKGPRAMTARIRLLWPMIVVLIALWLAAAALVVVSAAAAATGWAPPAVVGAGAVWLLTLAAAALTMGCNGVLVVVVTALAAALGNVLRGGAWPPLQPGSPLDLWTAFALIAGFVVLNAMVLQSVVGDAARYYRAAPANIAVRRATRQLAVDRLTALHRDARYDRIVVVAHSLGTVVAYDMLRAHWSQICTDLGDPAGDAEALAQNAADGRDPAFDRAAWQARGQRLLARLPGLPGVRRRWIVSDFITLGSPLTHAPFLMAEGGSPAELALSFKRKRTERELPQDPAWPIAGDGTMIFRLPDRALFHAGALFGLTRWTNLYFRLHATVVGDLVGGEVQSSFGPGITDVALPLSGSLWSRLLAHTRYFAVDDPNAVHLRALRDAVDLTRRGTPA